MIHPSTSSNIFFSKTIGHRNFERRVMQFGWLKYQITQTQAPKFYNLDIRINDCDVMKVPVA